MQRAARRRTTEAIAASLIAHAVVLTIAGLQHPTLVIPFEEAGPPEPIIPILLVPHAPPPAAVVPAPSPIRLHQRQPRFTPAEAPPIAPVVIPPPAPTAPPAPPGPVTVSAQPSPEAVQRTQVRAALKGLLGCSNPDLAGLTQAQRDACADRMGTAARNATFPGLGLGAEKRRMLEAAGAKKEADYRYTRSPAPPGSILAPSAGASAHDLATATGNDRSELKIPF